LQPHVMKLFGEGRWGIAQDKGSLLVGGQGAPIWLAGVIEKGCEEFDQIHYNMRGFRAFQNEVDFRASHSPGSTGSRGIHESHKHLVGCQLW